MSNNASKFKIILRKIPGLQKSYRFFKNDFKYLFYSKPNVLEIQGSKMYLNVREKDPGIRKTFRAYAKNRIHEAKTTSLFNKILKPGDTFFDLGANIGYFSLLASRLVGSSGQVYSFEPEPRNFKYLVRNRDLNNYTHMHPYNNAVSNKEEAISLYICPYDTGHHTIKQNEGILSYETTTDYDKKDITACEIKTLNIDNFVKNNKIKSIDLIKMDVEGAEFLALQGMQHTLKNMKNIKMVFEYFPLLIDKMGNSPFDFLDSIIKNHDLELYEIYDDYYADSGSESKLFFKIKNIDNIYNGYKNNKMYHINLFLVRKGDPLAESLSK